VVIVPRGPSVFFGGGFGGYYYPYPYPYPYYYGYPTGYPPPGPPPGWYSSDSYPPDEDAPQATPPPDAGAPPPPDESAAEAPPPADTATYGLIQLRSVPEGAAIDLDGRYWLDARRLDDRWLPVAPGLHTITVRQEGRATVERRVDVSPGGSQVVSMESFSDEAG